jgi:hypothetical protein
MTVDRTPEGYNAAQIIELAFIAVALIHTTLLCPDWDPEFLSGIKPESEDSL